ncbi:MAG: segregation/condensation protein A, partial [Anaerolineales bacterium]|nr:segregation/condensation protein A [Anaerolineales bacterium]
DPRYPYFGSVLDHPGNMSKYRVNLPVFEGPLDLLLSLIEREELDITRISLAQVADQYLVYLEQVEETRPDQLADFLVIAAKLVLLKSEALLPKPSRPAAEIEQDIGDELVEQLRLYKQFKAAAQNLQARTDMGLRTFIRLAPPPKVNPQPDLTGITLSDLIRAIQEALKLKPDDPPVDDVVSRRKITVREQMDLIRHRLQSKKRLVFQEMLVQATSRVEIAVTLLAVLELVKRRTIVVYQERLFGDIVIESKPKEEKPADQSAQK